jgi:hypothetical protein
VSVLVASGYALRDQHAVSMRKPGDANLQNLLDLTSFESGFPETEAMGRRLATHVLQGFYDAFRNPRTYEMTGTQVESRSVSIVLSGKTPAAAQAAGRAPTPQGVEVQFLRLGDVCLVAVLRELLAEPGLEIKWNSPFRKTFILYNATDKIGYLPPRNAFVSGGFEAAGCHWGPYPSFALLSGIVEEFRRFEFSGE